MISMNAKCTKATDCVWVFVTTFLALIAVLVLKDIALAPIQDHVKVIEIFFALAAMLKMKIHRY